jgi:hypothetical protein
MMGQFGSLGPLGMSDRADASGKDGTELSGPHCRGTRIFMGSHGSQVRKRSGTEMQTQAESQGVN